MWDFFKDIINLFTKYYKKKKNEADLFHLYRMTKNSFKKIDDEHKIFIKRLGFNEKLLTYSVNLREKDYGSIAEFAGETELYVRNKDIFEEFIDVLFEEIQKYIEIKLPIEDKFLLDEIRRISEKDNYQQRTYMISLLEELLSKGQYEKIRECAKTFDYFAGVSLKTEIALYECVYKMFCSDDDIKRDVEELLKKNSAYIEPFLIEICLYNKYIELGRKYILDFDKKSENKGIPIKFLENPLTIVSEPPALVALDGESITESNEILLLMLFRPSSDLESTITYSLLSKIKSIKSIIFPFYYSAVEQIRKAYDEHIEFEELDRFLLNNIEFINHLNKRFIEKVLQLLCEIYHVNRKFKSLENMLDDKIKQNDIINVYHHLNSDNISVEDCSVCIDKMITLKMDTLIYRALYKLESSEVITLLSERKYLLKKSPKILECYLYDCGENIDFEFFNDFDDLYKDSLEYQCVKYTFYIKKGVDIGKLPRRFDLIDKPVLHSYYAIVLYIDYLYYINNSAELKSLLSLKGIQTEEKLLIYRHLLLLDEKYFDEAFAYYKDKYKDSIEDVRIIAIYGSMHAKVGNIQVAKLLFSKLIKTSYRDRALAELIKMKILNFDYEDDEIIDECKKLFSGEMLKLLGDFYLEKSEFDRAKFYYELVFLYFPNYTDDVIGLYWRCYNSNRTINNYDKFAVGTTLVLKNEANKILNISLHDDKLKNINFNVTKFANSFHCFQGSSIIVDNNLFLLSKGDKCIIDEIDYVVEEILDTEDFYLRFIIKDFLEKGRGKLIESDSETQSSDLVNELVAEIPDTKDSEAKLIDIYNSYRFVLPLSYIASSWHMSLHKLYIICEDNLASAFQPCNLKEITNKNIILGYDIFILYSYVKEISFDSDDFNLYITKKLKNLLLHDLTIDKWKINTIQDNVTIYKENGEARLIIQNDTWKRIELERISRIESLIERCSVLESTAPYDGEVTAEINNKLNEISLFEMNMMQVAKNENYSIFSDDMFIVSLAEKSNVKYFGINTYLNEFANKNGIEKYVEMLKASVKVGYYKLWNISSFLKLYEMLTKIESEDVYEQTKENVLLFLNLEFVYNERRENVHTQFKKQTLLIFYNLYQMELFNSHNNREKWIFSFITEVAFKEYLESLNNTNWLFSVENSKVIDENL